MTLEIVKSFTMSTSHLSVVADHCAFGWALMCLCFWLNSARVPWGGWCDISFVPFQSHLQTGTCSVSPTVPVLSPGFACFCVHASDTLSQSIYFSGIYIVGTCSFLLFLLNYSKICVLDPAVARYIVAPVHTSQSPWCSNKWEAVGGRHMAVAIS